MDSSKHVGADRITIPPAPSIYEELYLLWEDIITGKKGIEEALSIANDNIDAILQEEMRSK